MAVHEGAVVCTYEYEYSVRTSKVRSRNPTIRDQVLEFFTSGVGRSSLSQAKILTVFRMASGKSCLLIIDMAA
jgi:hypothetical protein